MKIVSFLFLFALLHVMFAQEFYTDLNGFRLGQFREVPKNELRTLIEQDQLEDGFEYEIYLVEPDTSVYMTFEYASTDLQTIWSIQITGSKKDYDCRFRGLKLGMTTDGIEDVIGKSSSIEDAGEYGTIWAYDNTNFNLEITPNGTLGGIKIMDSSRDFFPKIELTKIPSFTQYYSILKSDDRKLISELLAPGIEIYYNDSTYAFRHSISNEILSDESKVFSLANKMAGILEEVNPQDSLQHEENVRLMLGNDPMHVAKFRLDEQHYEIVFKYLFGKYLIWEMKLN